jgi:dinuclear metal center YbgI/SA1388 family protein
MSRWLDEFLRVNEIEDYPGALNGLQVAGTRDISRIGAATDACQATIDLAVEGDCDFLVVHHGLFWDGSKPLVGPAFKRIQRLVESGLGLYSSHLPLDVHEEVGNNVLMASALGMDEVDSFGSTQGSQAVGVIGLYGRPLKDLTGRITDVCGSWPVVIAGGPEHVERIAVITGAGGSMIADAVCAGADTFVTGEGNHHTYHEALELGINLVYAGHYATETLGVRALSERVAERFGVEHVFFDVPTGL